MMKLCELPDYVNQIDLNLNQITLTGIDNKFFLNLRRTVLREMTRGDRDEP